MVSEKPIEFILAIAGQRLKIRALPKKNRTTMKKEANLKKMKRKSKPRVPLKFV